MSQKVQTEISQIEYESHVPSGSPVSSQEHHQSCEQSQNACEEIAKPNNEADPVSSQGYVVSLAAVSSQESVHSQNNQGAVLSQELSQATLPSDWFLTNSQPDSQGRYFLESCSDLMVNHFLETVSENQAATYEES